MNSVNEINISLLDDKILYGPGEENNITSEMRQKWDEVFTKLVAILSKEGFITDSTVIERDDASFSFSTKEDISFDKSIELLHALEDTFKVSSFHFYSEYDDWYESDPSVDIGIYSTI